MVRPAALLHAGKAARRGSSEYLFDCAITIRNTRRMEFEDMDTIS
jgi:hypothetical protein